MLRMRMNLAPLILFCFFMFGSVSMAAELQGVSLPDEIEVSGRKLVLNGLGLREATIFQIDVYVAGLYLESKSKNEDGILKSRETKSIRMQFVRGIGADTMRDSFLKSIRKNCSKDCGALEATVKDLGTRLPDIKVGDVMAYEFEPEQVRILFNGQEKGIIRGSENVTVVLASFIGPTPPDVEMKMGMLGLNDEAI